jgi:hypothetical protein
MDTRAPVGLMPAASDDGGENGSIHLTFEPFAIPAASTNITGQLVLVQGLIVLDGPDHDRKDQYFNVADGSGKSWLGHRYEYVRRHAQWGKTGLSPSTPQPHGFVETRVGASCSFRLPPEATSRRARERSRFLA